MLTPDLVSPAPLPPAGEGEEAGLLRGAAIEALTSTRLTSAAASCQSTMGLRMITFPMSEGADIVTRPPTARRTAETRTTRRIFMAAA